MKNKVFAIGGAILCIAIFVSSLAGAAEIKLPSEVERSASREIAYMDLDAYFTDVTPSAPPEPTPTPTPSLDESAVEMLACAIYQEAGGNACCDLCRHRVGDVILNRLEDDRFPDTLEEVLTQYKQYGRFYWTGIVWPERATQAGEAAAVERAYQTARDILSGEHSDLYGNGYIFQAEFEQGEDVIYCEDCGIYYGR